MLSFTTQKISWTEEEFEAAFARMCEMDRDFDRRAALDLMVPRANTIEDREPETLRFIKIAA